MTTLPPLRGGARTRHRAEQQHAADYSSTDAFMLATLAPATSHDGSSSHDLSHASSGASRTSQTKLDGEWPPRNLRPRNPNGTAHAKADSGKKVKKGGVKNGDKAEEESQVGLDDRSTGSESVSSVCSSGSAKPDGLVARVRKNLGDLRPFDESVNNADAGASWNADSGTGTGQLGRENAQGGGGGGEGEGTGGGEPSGGVPSARTAPSTRAVPRRRRTAGGCSFDSSFDPVLSTSPPAPMSASDCDAPKPKGRRAAAAAALAANASLEAPPIPRTATNSSAVSSCSAASAASAPPGALKGIPPVGGSRGHSRSRSHRSGRLLSRLAHRPGAELPADAGAGAAAAAPSSAASGAVEGEKSGGGGRHAEGLPMLPPPDAPQIVKCQSCNKSLAVPPSLPPSAKGYQRLRCGKCLQISKYALYSPATAAAATSAAGAAADLERMQKGEQEEREGKEGEENGAECYGAGGGEAGERSGGKGEEGQEGPGELVGGGKDGKAGGKHQRRATVDSAEVLGAWEREAGQAGGAGNSSGGRSGGGAGEGVGAGAGGGSGMPPRPSTSSGASQLAVASGFGPWDAATAMHAAAAAAAAGGAGGAAGASSVAGGGGASAALPIPGLPPLAAHQLVGSSPSGPPPGMFPPGGVAEFLRQQQLAWQQQMGQQMGADMMLQAQPMVAAGMLPPMAPQQFSLPMQQPGMPQQFPPNPVSGAAMPYGLAGPGMPGMLLPPGGMAHEGMGQAGMAQGGMMHGGMVQGGMGQGGMGQGGMGQGGIGQGGMGAGMNGMGMGMGMGMEMGMGMAMGGPMGGSGTMGPLGEEGGYSRRVVVNSVPITDPAVARAEELAGPIHPGSYWYDVHAGFWGVMGGPCLGIIPAGIWDLALAPLLRHCSNGHTRVLVNGRELQRRDLDILMQRGLLDHPGAAYLLDIHGNLADATNGEPLPCLGKLAPS
ncbi:unnamed protein product [Closterium sp. Naga37s-1]|nr:unnamed protein product [Closterium sp. Naga37s-1]